MMDDALGLVLLWPVCACCLFFGLPLFALYAPGGSRMVQRHLPMVAMVAGLACLALLLSALGFALQGASMTGLPLTQPDLSMAAELFNGTSMGTALKARLDRKSVV